MRSVLGRNFFQRSAPIVAKDLIGKFLVRQTGRRTSASMITEAEAYTGRDDMSSHARMGPTPRNRAMFGPPGHWYVYFIYGMYHCVNIVTEKEGEAGAVLIRGLENCRGPGKLCRELLIDKTLYGKPATPGTGLWIEDRGVRPKQVKQTPRINVSGTAKFKKRRWRFVLA